MNITKSSIYVDRAWSKACGCGLNLTIDGIPADIIDPKASTTSLGIVYLTTRDYEKGSWEQLLPVQTKFGREFKGCTDDPRILELANKMLNDRLLSRDIGVTYGPIQDNGIYSVGKLHIADYAIAITDLEDATPQHTGRIIRISIGEKPAKIILPQNETLIAQGIVKLHSLKDKNTDWDQLIECRNNGQIFLGCTNDPRVLNIAKIGLHGTLLELQNSLM